MNADPTQRLVRDARARPEAGPRRHEAYAGRIAAPVCVPGGALAA